ncbi:Reverse transcriptase (RNA-dependent DNA polymerase) [Pseudosulfitobacter pseudonitzschiae]|uniref:reverse transcriptase family protein n=1 Tax=Pseudosulfitobacter pseudonitzschiae TaxID=1402135 RepID=UPI00056D0468|nr:reverse transcriptase family protein [Pseudosulfitobacter pseudonitzschiae]QKS11341.1 RNA-directed DNA polymerase [Pseudosulfitobacter pseudonitzschiae]SHG31303.1 Reverse transcriptase (RNA-dependent DNA polymerase) [Pseudosulfitobacter pseudonitzschiae]
MTKRRDKSYALDQCALYRCSTRKKLFKLLQTSSEKFAELKAAPDLYKPLRKKKKDGTFRPVLAPRGDLKRIQRRIGELLLRVETPDYLMSPVRGRSNIDNAARHRGAAAFHLLDIEDFYPSCTASKVAWFFGKYLGCPPDVVKVLLDLTTLNGVLPAGSPASPSLAFWAYADMWDEIDQLTRDAGCQVSVYVDDITVSGQSVPGVLIHAIKERLAHHGHSFKASKEIGQINAPVVVTGVVVRDRTLLMPNVQHLERHKLRAEVAKLPEGYEKAQKMASLIGREGTERQILARNNFH